MKVVRHERQSIAVVVGGGGREVESRTEEDLRRPCDDCGSLIQPSTSKAHYQFDCPFRLQVRESCRNCKSSLRLNDMPHHLSYHSPLGPKIQTSYPECKIQITPMELPRHRC
jgi:hypothetical protein